METPSVFQQLWIFLSSKYAKFTRYRSFLFIIYFCSFVLQFFFCGLFFWRSQVRDLTWPYFSPFALFLTSLFIPAFSDDPLILILQVIVLSLPLFDTNHLKFVGHDRWGFLSILLSISATFQFSRQFYRPFNLRRILILIPIIAIIGISIYLSCYQATVPPLLPFVLTGMAISRAIIPRPYDIELSGYGVDYCVYCLSQIAFAVLVTMGIIQIVIEIDAKLTIARDISHVYFLGNTGGGDFLVVYTVLLFALGIWSYFGFGDGVLVSAALLILVLPRVTQRVMSMQNSDNAAVKLMEIKTAIVIATCYKLSRLRKPSDKVIVRNGFNKSGTLLNTFEANPNR